MIKIIFLALVAVCMVSCTTTQHVQTVVIPTSIAGKSGSKVVLKAKDRIPVRLTVYWSKGGGGSDYWTRRKQSSTGEKLSEGVSVAADPSVFAYGKVIYIKGVGVRKVTDTGSKVVDRTAAKRGAKLLLRKRAISKDEYALLSRCPVVDLYFENRSDAIRFSSCNPMFTEISVLY